MTTSSDRNADAAHALAELFRAQSALNTALGRWQAQWPRSPQSPSLTLQEAGLAVSFYRSSEGLYNATLLHGMRSGVVTYGVEAVSC